MGLESPNLPRISPQCAAHMPALADHPRLDSCVTKVGDHLHLKLVLEQKIKVPAHFMAKVFTDREEDGEDLLLNAIEGPFSQPYFIGIICAHRKAEEKEKTVKAAKVKPEKLKEERDEAVAKVTARGGKLIAAAHRVLLARLDDKESLAAEATETERTRVEQAIVQARAPGRRSHAAAARGAPRAALSRRVCAAMHVVVGARREEGRGGAVARGRREGGEEVGRAH